MKYNKYKHILELDLKYEDNYLTIDDEDFYLENIDRAFSKSKGSNSCIFRLTSADENQDVSYVIKFCRSPILTSTPPDKMRVKRFDREIEALKICKDNGLNDFIIKIEKIGYHSEGEFKFRYYIMEEAEYDLANYMEENEYSLPEKLVICKEILDSAKKLHELGIYHRDIKPDNILMVNGRWKIGDLGLIKYRDEDIEIDYPKDRIGPFGYYSPEAINYGLSLRTEEEDGFFKYIDEKSDIYQLGLVFWYIFEQQIPTGQVRTEDLASVKDPYFFNEIIMPMLQYCKKRRASITDLQDHFFYLMKEWGVI